MTVSPAAGAAQTPPASPASTPEEPWPVRVVSQKIGSWIAKLGWVWIDGQIAQVSLRPGANTVVLTLRDPAAHLSLTVTTTRDVLDRAAVGGGGDLTDGARIGARIVAHAKPEFYAGRGTLSLRAD